MLLCWTFPLSSKMVSTTTSDFQKHLEEMRSDISEISKWHNFIKASLPHWRFHEDKQETGWEGYWNQKIKGHHWFTEQKIDDIIRETWCRSTLVFRNIKENENESWENSTNALTDTLWGEYLKYSEITTNGQKMKLIIESKELTDKVSKWQTITTALLLQSLSPEGSQRK